MDQLILQFNNALTLLQKNVPFLLWLFAGLWIFQLVNWLLGYRLNLLGIYPRSVRGIIGIAISPLLHGDFNHLFFNSIPLFVLASFVLLQGQQVFVCVSVIIILLSGTAVWLFGRPAIHIGASGVVMGYWSYLLMNAYQQPGLITVVLAISSLYYFGGLAMNLFPRVKTSWEGHVFGFLAGIAAVYLLPWVNKFL